MRVLVTGATGCVGANIVEALLARGYEPVALRRVSSPLLALEDLDVETVLGNVMEPSSLARAMQGCALVFHAAAIAQYWRYGAEEVYRVNVQGTRNVLQAALAAGVQRLVFTSSVAVLGKPRARGQLLDETASFNLRPRRFPYGHSKVVAESIVQAAVADGLDAVIVNPATVIGQRDIHFVGGEILRAARRGWLVAAPPGMMGIVSARDTGIGHVLAAERGQKGQRYILNGENLRHYELAKMATALVGVAPPRLKLPRGLLLAGAPLARLFADRLPVDGTQLYLSAQTLAYDGRRAVERLGFAPVGARQALEEAWLWYHGRGML